MQFCSLRFDEPVAEIVQCGEPPPKIRSINDLQRRPIATLELPPAQRMLERFLALMTTI